MAKSSVGGRFVAEASTMTLQELNNEIHRLQYGWETGGSSQGRRSFFKALVAFEKIREDRFSIEAPIRRYNRK
ncbi:MAG: hypothetical protein U5N55_08400 [Cypionkella sp.]|nr:hypothetical protein [Cypionkella sp.]